MTRKHFEAIAAAMAERRRLASPETAATLDVLAQDLATVLATTNPGFLRARFLAACRGE